MKHGAYHRTSTSFLTVVTACSGWLPKRNVLFLEHIAVAVTEVATLLVLMCGIGCQPNCNTTSAINILSYYWKHYLWVSWPRHIVTICTSLLQLIQLRACTLTNRIIRQTAHLMPVSSPCPTGRSMVLSHHCLSWNGSTSRNLINVQRSFNEFWIGVPENIVTQFCE